MTENRERFEYDVCISFANEDREIAERLAQELRDCGRTVYYQEARLLGNGSLSEALQNLFPRISIGRNSPIPIVFGQELDPP